VHRCDEHAVGANGVREEFRVDVADHQFGAPEPHDRAAGTGATPGEVEEPLTLLAEHGRPSQVDRAVVADDGAHVDLPPGGGGVAAHRADGMLADLHGHVHVAQEHAVDLEIGPRQVVALDDDPHQPPTLLNAASPVIGGTVRRRAGVSPAAGRRTSVSV
jgi:hypothetical protein